MMTPAHPLPPQGRSSSMGPMHEEAQDVARQPVWEKRVSLILICAPLVFFVLFALLYIDASIGHDGLHCELGWAWSEHDNDCGGFWG